MAPAGRDAVLFISFGGPEKAEDIRPFLAAVTRGRRIPPERIEEAARHYRQIGGASPINAVTRAQAEALRRRLADDGLPLPVYIGQRNWHPLLRDTLRRMAADGVRRAVAFSTAAHRTEASLERYVAAAEEARREAGPGAPAIDYVGPWFDHPLFIEAIASRAAEAASGIPAERRADAVWMFTAHSIPCAMAKDSTYVLELQTTAEAVCRAMGRRAWCSAYTSRSGDPRDAWLEPSASDAIRHLARRGARDVLVVPIGFVADHVEVLYDLDIEARRAAKEAGIAFYRAKTVGDHPLFVEMMADVVRRRISGGARPEETSSRSTLFQDGRRADGIGRGSPVCYCRPEATNPPCLSDRRKEPGR